MARPVWFKRIRKHTTPSPGIGIPMCLVSGEHTAAAVREAETPGAVSTLFGRR